MRDFDVIAYRTIQVFATQACERRRKAIRVPVTRQAWNDDVMSSVVERCGDALVLRGARGHAVEQHNRALAARAVHVRERSPFCGNAGMIARDEPVEAIEAGSQPKFLKTIAVHILSDQARELVAREERYGARNYAPLDLIVERAEGVWL